MVNAKIIKSSTTITGITISLLIVMAIFTGMYLWLNMNLDKSGASMDDSYVQTYVKLNASQAKLDSNINDIKNTFGAEDGLKEADSGFFGLNGLKGMLALLKMPFTMVDVAGETLEATSINLTIIPSWVKVLVTIGIVAVIIFALIAALKGEPGSMK